LEVSGTHGVMSQNIEIFKYFQRPHLEVRNIWFAHKANTAQLFMCERNPIKNTVIDLNFKTNRYGNMLKLL
jgi:hypothetical protein